MILLLWERWYLVEVIVWDTSVLWLLVGWSVQVARTFEDFEKFHVEASQQYPQFTLPPLPRKIVVFMSKDTIKERQKAFSAIVEFASKTAKLSKSAPFYALLGVDPLGDRFYVKKRQDWLEAQKEKKRKDLFTEEDDLFGSEPSEEQGMQTKGSAEAGEWEKSGICVL